MNRIYLCVFVIATAIIHTGCVASRPNATAGGLLGGTTGGIIGAAIGSREGKSGEGALIGAVAGGLTGATIGNQADEANARNQAYANQQAAAARQAAVTIDQVIQMSASGLSDALITNQIIANGFAQPLSTNDLIQLKSRGVSDAVIQQMQTVGARPVSNIVPAMTPPIPMYHIEPHYAPVYHGPPVFRIPPTMIHGPPGRHRRGGISVRF